MAPVTIQLNERTMYDLDWLEDCYKRVKFPNPKCEELLVEVNEGLSHKITGELDNQVKQQALFQLLGEDYVRIHFPHHKYNPKIFHEANPELKKAYTKDMKQMIDRQLDVTLKELGYPEDVSTYKEENQLGSFLDEIRRVFKAELEHQITLASNEERIKDIENDAVDAMDDNQTSNESDIQSMETFQKAQVPGDAYVATAKVKRNESIKLAMKGFARKCIMFSPPIRQFIWENSIYTLDGREDSIEERSKEFKRMVQKKMTPGQLQRAVQSQDYKRIYREVIDCYYSTTHLKSIGDDRGIDAAHVINIVNLIDKTFSNAQIFLLVPLQTVYPKNGEQQRGKNNEDYIIRLSSHLHTLSKSILPGWEKIFSQAEDVLKTMQEKDSEYFEHINSIIKDGMQPVDVHKFAYEILVKGQKKSVKIWNDLEKKRRKNWKQNELEIFADVGIYLRKWISEGFVGLFSNPAILFIWDYLFMNNWKCMRKLCIVTLSLIRPWAMRALSQRELVRVFNEEPGKIYLQDLRRALVAYDRDNIDTLKIAACNTNFEVVEPEEPEKESKNDKDEKENEVKEEPTEKDEDQKEESDQTGDKTEEANDKSTPVEDESTVDSKDETPEKADDSNKDDEKENIDKKE